jgi:hypothetical protein
MSQLQVTGEAKIRDIQGPVVANDGVITALDGAASQYVRGDGTLADFPTSSGGGSSVSYYLNSSVSQGTIGGVAYRELSKDPIIGAGTDIAISADGYVASYITDANDPDVVIVPGGNFNCEFYFSVNNNTGNPTTYAELYKYDGTTFTLLGTSSGVPESINQGTTIAPYYFAIPVATAALALTDRLAIRIYVNVDGRTVTLHTENGHLCQVVTTLSKGMVSLNNLTDQSQFLTTGTSGTNFAIVSSGDTHTFNLPVASASNTGKLSSTDWSTFNNKQPAGNYVTLDTTQTITAYKTFSSTFGTQFDYGIYSPLTSRFDEGILFLKGNTPAIFTDITTNLYSEATSNNLVIRDENSKAKLVFDNSTQTYTFPNASGTIALTSDLSGYVTLGTAQVITGSKIFGSSVSIITGSQASLSVLSSTGNSALILGYVNNVLKGTIDISATEFKLISAIDNILKFQSSTNFKASLIFSNTADYSYTYPNATGTIALTSNLSSYLPLAGGTLTGDLTIAKADTLNVLTLSSTNTNVISFITSSVQKGEISVNGSNFQFNSATTNGYIFKNSASNNVLTITDAGVTTLIGALTGTSATFSGALDVRNANSYFGSQKGYVYIFEDQINSYFSTDADATLNINYFGYNQGTTRFRSFDVYNGKGGKILGLNGATGAATFSSSVQIQSSNGIKLNRSANDYYWQINSDSSNYLNFGAYLANGTAYGTNPKMILLDNGNVGIGTSSPSEKLDLQGTMNMNGSSGTYLQIQYNGGNRGYLGTANATIASGSTGDLGLSATSNLVFGSGGSLTERMRITSGGNVGIGTSSPASLLEIAATGPTLRINSTTGGNDGILAWYVNTNYIGDIRTNSGSGAMTFNQGPSAGWGGYMVFKTDTTERMRITSGGYVLVNRSTTLNNGYFEANGDAGRSGVACNQISTGTSYQIYFSNPNGIVGSISTNGSTTSYNTSSDYRLKEDLKEINGLEKVSAIKVYDFKWKNSEDRMDGVIAHELAEVLPYAVSGEKDKEKMQGVDYSKLVPVLVKAIQELEARIKQLENK